MTMLKKLLVVTVTGAILSGCASSPTDELYDRLEAMEERQQDLQEQYAEHEQERREAEIDAMPAWILEPPQADSTGVYGVGMSKSKSAQFGLRAARLDAEFQVAKMFNQELSGSERSFAQGDTEGNVTTQTRFLIDKIVDAVPVVGYDVVEQVIIPVDGVDHSYVLLKMPFEEFNRVLKAQKTKALDVKVQASFDDLERRLDKRRAQLAEQEQRIFEREQEAIKNRSDILQAQGDHDDISKQ